LTTGHSVDKNKKKLLTRLDNFYIVGAKKLNEKPINDKIKRHNLCVSEFTCFHWNIPNSHSIALPTVSIDF